MLLRKEEMTPAGLPLCKFTPPRTRAGPQAWFFSSHMGSHLSSSLLTVSCGFPVFGGGSGISGTMPGNHRVRGHFLPQAAAAVSGLAATSGKVRRFHTLHCLDPDVSSATRQCSTGLSFKCHTLDFICQDLSGYLGAHIAQLHCFEQIEGGFVI